MRDNEVVKTIERLSNACVWNKFDDPGVYAEYVRVLKKYNYRQMDRAIDIVLENDSRNAPAISALIKAYQELEPDTAMEITNETYCSVCDDKGFIIMTEFAKDDDGKAIEYNKMPVRYQYALYCPFCPVGQSQAYDGSKCKRKSPYRMEPLTKYLDDAAIAELREANMRRHDLRTERQDIAMEGVAP